ncbi:MAG: hypothetical protein HKN43_12475 [Rhodothermales bacterium]|nr:hypothetical protein [Rhodothermales bacterium]
MTRLVPVLLLAFLLFIPEVAFSQSGSFFNQRDDQYTLLGLKRAKEAYDVAKTDYERQLQLFEKQLISESEKEQARRQFADAEVNYQQSLLAVLFEQQYVTVTKAIKFQGRNGSKRVRLELSNAAGGSAEFQKLINIEDELFRSLQPDIVNNVYVSLLNDEDAIISSPYEAKINELKFGEPSTLYFTLLQDVDVVTVNLIYGSGSERRLKVFLQKDSSVNVAAIQAEQFSQEVELGASTDFPLSLELFSGSQNTFKLDVVNLPSSINRYFLDPTSANRLSQFQFTEGVNTRQAALRVFLPERPTETVSIDDPIQFYALAIPRDRIEEIGDLRDAVMTQEQIEALNVGFVRLELVPRGVGEILVRIPQLFHTIKPSESVDITLEIVNEGSRELNSVQIDVDPPLNWIDSVSPETIPRMEINGEQRVTLNLAPPPDVSPGRYEVRVQTTSLSDDQTIRGEDKTITIQIDQEANVFGTTILVLLIVGLVVGIVIFGIRLTRR